jgi:pimeloyl-ACP methyl ester carboxylesterase
MDHETHSFDYAGHRLVYDDYGEGDHLVVYLHGILLDSELNRGIAGSLAADGFRVVLLDLLGHGRSDRPAFASDHRMDAYARQVAALLDHLGVDDAVLGGVSLGANVSLFVATMWPRRVRGLILEMPVLEWATPAAAMLFVPLLMLNHYGRRLVGLTARINRRLPRTPWGPVNSFLNSASSDPDSQAAVLHGVIVGPVAPTREERAAITAPTLVLGHGNDPIHPFDDAQNLAHLMPAAELVPTFNFAELRFRPARLRAIISAFAAERWTAPVEVAEVIDLKRRVAEGPT